MVETRRGASSAKRPPAPSHPPSKRSKNSGGCDAHAADEGGCDAPASSAPLGGRRRKNCNYPLADEMETLIPGLTDDAAGECLTRVAYDHLHLLDAVCPRWSQEVRSPDFLRRRRLAGVTRPLLVLYQATPPPPPGDNHQLDLHHTLFDPTSGKWRRLPPLPLRRRRPPRRATPAFETQYGGLAAVGHAVVTMASNVRIYDFITATWRKGLPMPGPPRERFACASDGVRRIFVAGGFDRRTGAPIRSAMVYDVEENRWEPLPDMARDGGAFLDKGVFHSGVFHVISQRQTITNDGHYMQLLDVSSHPPPGGCGWSIVGLNGMMADDVFHNQLVAAYEGKMYCCIGDKLHVKEGQIWRPVLDVPPSVTPYGYLTSWRGGLLMAGAAGIHEPLKVYTLMLGGDERRLSWTEHRVPQEFERIIWRGCWLEI